MSDYRTLLADAIARAEEEHEWNTSTDMLGWMADAVLDTRIPDLCPDCKGTDGMVSYTVPATGYTQRFVCTHLNAPTIADLLQWGERHNELIELLRRALDVAMIRVIWSRQEDTVECNEFIRDVRAALRGEGQ